jgi:hypothetical protein
MLASGTVDEIRRLLGQGELSQRAIARVVGVSRGTVNAIACGRRPERAADPPLPDDQWPPLEGPAVRCPTCGGMVRMPCLACRVRRLRGW